MSDRISSTFGSWSDRLTYIVAEGQLVVLGVLFMLGAGLVLYQPDLPSVPPIVVGWLAALMLFGPPLLAFWITFVRRLRRRRRIAVHHVDATHDTVQKYYVAPEIWSEKTVDGANPYPVNGGSGWAVQSFEFVEDVEQLTVEGVWLSECEDTKLMTSKSHMEAIYGKLTESHIALNIMRDSISELGADIQKRVTNKGAEAREKGTMMDETAVKDVFDDFTGDIADTGPGDLPTIDVEELLDDADLEGDAASDTEEVPADD